LKHLLLIKRKLPLACLLAGFFGIFLFASCGQNIATPEPTDSLATQTETSSLILPSPTQETPTFHPTQTQTPGSSPTSTVMPPLSAHTWQAAPVMVEAARTGNDPLDPFQYSPFFVLYGDGLLVKRTCQEGICQYTQTQPDQEALCRLVNAIDRTGFFNADPEGFSLPGGTGEGVRLAVQVYAENEVLVPDLDRWATSPNWYPEIAGCLNCYSPPQIDPAFLDLYRLLSTYTNRDWTGLQTERLALWITQPVIAGSPQNWDPDLIPLSKLVSRSMCSSDPSQQQAIILEGSPARAVADFLSNRGRTALLFQDGEQVWQVQSRWLLPYEMPQSCQQPAGLYPPLVYSEIFWTCEPEMGAIPTPTATITPTPSITPTPLR